MSQRYLPPDYFSQPIGRVRRLTNLQIDDVSSVDKGAGHDCRVVLHKRHGGADPLSDEACLARRRQWEAEGIAKGIARPRWEPPEHWEKEREMNKSANPFGEVEALTDGLRKGQIGKNVAFLKMRSWFDKNMYDMDRKDASGQAHV